MGVFIKLEGDWTAPLSMYRKEGETWVQITESTLRSHLSNHTSFYGGHINNAGLHFLQISGMAQITGESCSYSAIYDGYLNVTTAATWSIINGSEFASINSSTGEITILNGASSSPVVIQVEYSGVTAVKNIVLTYEAGTTSETKTEIVVNDSGETTITTTTVTTDSSGTSITNSSVQILGENGDTIGSQESVKTENPDGSFTGTSVNYDAQGNATDGTNTSGDTNGNVNTQEVAYDASGNTVVTGYEIDTSASQGEGKEITGEGVDTEFIPFSDNNCGFVCHMKFETIKAAQPRPPLVEDTEDTSTNYLYNIMSAKSTTKIDGGWPGFDIRWALKKTDGSPATGTGIQFRYTQSGSTSTTGRDLTGKTEDGTASGNFYDLTITYDPQLVLPTSRNTFSVTSANGCIASVGTNISFITNNIDFTLGYAINMQGNPYRYANVTIHDFSITKICSSAVVIPAAPVIMCSGEEVTITCETANASIYYRLGSSGNYSRYTSEIPITADTVVYAYSELMGETSDVVQQNCIYDNGIEEPVIECDGSEVIITCETPSVTLYYRLDQEGSFIEYLSPFSITADTVVEAYAELNGKTSDTVMDTCIYVDGIRKPIISYSNGIITITCGTQGAIINYKLDDDVNYSIYSAPIEITADTVVYAYSELSGDTSEVVSATCIYTYDYSLDYLTFVVLTGGTIAWNSFGSGYAKAIQYSINKGEWTSITASTATTISVSDGDVVRFKGANTTYAGSKSNYSGFEGGTAYFNIEGNIMSLIYGDNFDGNSTLTSGTYNFCSIFKKANVVSAENLILPSLTLTNYCYRAMFSLCPALEVAPALPATTLSQGCYWYMFEGCLISTAPELVATTLVRECYGNMFINCANLSYIKCMATTSLGVTSGLTNWVSHVAASGIFVKDANTTWANGVSGIPNGWTVYNDTPLYSPKISFDGVDLEITCETTAATVYYKLGENGTYTVYTTGLTLSADTMVYAYSTYGGQTSPVVSENCELISDIPLEASNRNLTNWKYNGQDIQTPYSVNRIDGHSSSYAKGSFGFETSFNLHDVQPAYLWFQHADQSADIYVDDVKADTHWGGYNAFFSDISNYVHKGTNRIRVILNNTTRNTLAPAAGDFNFNATLGNVKLLTSPVLPDMSYGYDGFHVVSNVTSSSATITVKTLIPAGAEVVCTIDDDTYHYSDSGNSTGQEMQFKTVIQNPHLWNGTLDPHLYNIKLEIYYNGDLYHRFQRPYGLRYYDYVYGDTSILPNNEPYTGFLLNGSPYYLRGVCMHHDKEGKANALTTSDIAADFNLIDELGCNFIRLAHYPHPKEVYDKCDELGIIVQTEVPCVNKFQTTMPEEYYTHLYTQYADMVNQHFNHPSIMFWGLFNEATTDDTTWAKTKLEDYRTFIKNIDSERWVGYVMSHSYSNPSSAMGNPNMDWFGGNIYVGWYIDKASNDPTTQLNTRVGNIITNLHKPLAFSEYGCGGTQHCHSEYPQTTTTKGNYERHDIEYQMWLHEGHIAALRNFPQLLFTAQWQLFDIAVSSRNEGYTICLDGETTSTDDELRRLNNKGLVERDHVTKKDTFYIYKAEWSSETFVHICGKDYTRKTDRVIKCYTNDGNSLSLYVNNVFVETVTVTNHIALFTATNFNAGDVITVTGDNTNDTFTFE